MFKSSIGRAAGPAVLTLVLAGAAACGPTSPGTSQAGAAPAAANVAEPAATAARGSPAAAPPAG
ncbi:hypothetical protein ACFVGO_33340, partial [Kitasatospora sp. NPDC057738]